MESTQAQVLLTEKELEKREKMRTYMREYKQRKYLEDRDKENQFHRSYLIKRKLSSKRDKKTSIGLERLQFTLFLQNPNSLISFFFSNIKKEL